MIDGIVAALAPAEMARPVPGAARAAPERGAAGRGFASVLDAVAGPSDRGGVAPEADGGGRDSAEAPAPTAGVEPKHAPESEAAPEPPAGSGAVPGPGSPEGTPFRLGGEGRPDPESVEGDGDPSALGAAEGAAAPGALAGPGPEAPLPPVPARGEGPAEGAPTDGSSSRARGPSSAPGTGEKPRGLGPPPWAMGLALPPGLARMGDGSGPSGPVAGEGGGGPLADSGPLPAAASRASNHLLAVPDGAGEPAAMARAAVLARSQPGIARTETAAGPAAGPAAGGEGAEVGATPPAMPGRGPGEGAQPPMHPPTGQTVAAVPAGSRGRGTEGPSGHTEAPRGRGTDPVGSASEGRGRALGPPDFWARAVRADGPAVRPADPAGGRAGAEVAGFDRLAPAPPFAPPEAALGTPPPPAGEGAVARHVARQVAAHPALRTGGTAELSLAPEELGPLRLSVEGPEGSLRLVIEAVRPETAELLRRHVEALRQELRQEGLSSVGVSIGGGDARREGAGGFGPGGGGFGGGGGPLGVPTAGPGPDLAPSLVPPTAARSRGTDGHLDLRF